MLSISRDRRLAHGHRDRSRATDQRARLAAVATPRVAAPEYLKPVRAIARPIWSLESRRAFKFVRIADVDRLILAEHLDFVSVRGDVLH